MDFGAALKALKEGKRVARKGWNGKGMWLVLQRPDMFSHMTLPYIYIEYPKNPKHHAYPEGSRCPWVASQTDMLSEDWFVLEDEAKSEKEPYKKGKDSEVEKDFEEFLNYLNKILGDEEVEVHVIRVHN